MRYLLIALLSAAACSKQPAPPPELPGTLRLGEQIKIELREQKDEAKARRQVFDETIEHK